MNLTENERDTAPPAPTGCQGFTRLVLTVLFLGILGGCSAERRDQDMDQYFHERHSELSRLLDQLRHLKKKTGIRGINLEDEKVYLYGTASLSLDGALRRFPGAVEEIKQARKLEKSLAIRNAYLLDDGSFWVILDEADVFGADFGFLREGKKPVATYGILSDSRPLTEAEGWHIIKF